jgi:hypothetical protein
LEILKKVDVISAVSGGSYALSWLLLQPFYHQACHKDPDQALSFVQKEMFNLKGSFQEYLENNAKPLGALNFFQLVQDLIFLIPFNLVLFYTMQLFVPLLRFSPERFALKRNGSSLLRRSYREGIQRTFQVFPDKENKIPQEKISLTDKMLLYADTDILMTRKDVPPVSFQELSSFAQRVGLPAYVFNATVFPPKPSKNADLNDRIFEFGPMGFGSNSCGYLSWQDTVGPGSENSATDKKRWFRNALHKTDDNRICYFPVLNNFNVAPAISGAAVCGSSLDNMKARWAIRLANLGLDYIIPSPMDKKRLLRLSDGGHSENLGAFALLKRKCRNIIIVDAEHDPKYTFKAYKNLKESAQKLNIDINQPDIDDITEGKSRFDPDSPILVGKTSFGKLYYIKLSLPKNIPGDQAEAIQKYLNSKHDMPHKDPFPQESTVDQNFEPKQFRAYRALGYAIAGAMKL